MTAVKVLLFYTYLQNVSTTTKQQAFENTRISKKSMYYLCKKS